MFFDGLSRLRDGKAFRAQGDRGKPIFHFQGNFNLKKSQMRLKVNLNSEKNWLALGTFYSQNGKFSLAEICFRQALRHNSKNIHIQAELATLKLIRNPFESLFLVNQVRNEFLAVLKKDANHLEANFNLGLLYNYYRIFEHSLRLWKRVSKQKTLPKVKSRTLGGLAIASQGRGKVKEAKGFFKQSMGLSSYLERFVAPYHLAAQASSSLVRNQSECLSHLGKVDSDDLFGFEKSAFDRLKRDCAGRMP